MRFIMSTKKKRSEKKSPIQKIQEQMDKGLMTQPSLSEPENAMCRNLVVQFYEIQEIRKAMNNAKNMIERDYKGRYKKFDTEPQERVIEQVEGLEKNILNELMAQIQKVRIYAWLQQVEGIGPIISAGLISALQSPDRFANPSKMTRFCGLAPVDWCKECDKRYIEPSKKNQWASAEAARIEERKSKSKKNVKKKQKDIMKLLCDCEEPEVIQVAEKKVKGLPIHYNPFLKTLTTYKIGYLGFVMHKGFYRSYYDKYRAEEDLKHPDLSDGQRFARARRKTVKLFIQHFWNAWRRSNGLGIVTPYVMITGNHNYIKPPHEDIIQYLEDDWKMRQANIKKSKKNTR